MISAEKNRAKGALMGAFIGEALGVGPHWYYDLEEMRQEYGDWMDDYTEPKADRYHGGLKAGEISQAGILLKMMTEHLLENNGYDRSAFCKMMDEDFLPKISGKAMAGPGGYTSQSMRHLWRARVKNELPWDQVAGNADTTEAIERNIAQAIFYADDLKSLSLNITDNTALTQADNLIASLTVAYSSVLALLVQGEKLDSEISAKLMRAVDQGKLPFHKVTSDNLNPPAEVLHALNGGGQNQVRTMLTGALIGAQLGFSRIPRRFIDGLQQKDELLNLADKLVEKFE